MRPLREDPLFRASMAGDQVVHVLSVAAEDQCLGYPTSLRAFRLPARHHTILALDDHARDERADVAEARARQRARLSALLPAVRLATLDDVLAAIAPPRRGRTFCVDVSGMSRPQTCRVVDAVLEAADAEASVFCIYSPPKRYRSRSGHGAAHGVEVVFAAPAIPRSTSVELIMLPGLDVGETSTALVHAVARSDGHAAVRWLFPVPSRRRGLYEDVLEAHLDMLSDGTSVGFLPEDDLRAASECLQRELHGAAARPVVIVPLGSSLTCVSAVLAVREARRAGGAVNILLPMPEGRARRTEDYYEPMVEAIVGGGPCRREGEGDAHHIDGGQCRDGTRLWSDAVDRGAAGGGGPVLDHRPEGVGAGTGHFDEPALSPPK